MGLRAELIYPNQVIILIVLLERLQELQNGNITYIRKNGNQQNTNTPIIIPKVRAAFLSLDNDIRCFSSMNWWTKTDFFWGFVDFTINEVSVWEAFPVLGNFSASDFSGGLLFPSSIVASFPSDELPFPGDMLGTSDNDSSACVFGTSNECWEHFVLCLQRFFPFRLFVFVLYKTTKLYDTALFPSFVIRSLCCFFFHPNGADVRLFCDA